ncbi:MAG: hypothetical protein PHI84_21780, partial [Kiritimatiellae bacterium]|nr:hypothetical protein [Kiritimatiellia bacterium]
MTKVVKTARNSLFRVVMVELNRNNLFLVALVINLLADNSSSNREEAEIQQVYSLERTPMGHPYLTSVHCVMFFPTMLGHNYYPLPVAIGVVAAAETVVVAAAETVVVAAVAVAAVAAVAVVAVVAVV